MRDLKFKAWNKKTNKMIPPFGMGDIDMLDSIPPRIFAKDETGELEIYYFDELEDLIFLQWTGRKDKNGKEIYEGNIVTYDGNKPTVVEYHAGSVSFQMNLSKFVLDQEAVVDYDEIIVIGNIYENPELLQPNEEKER